MNKYGVLLFLTEKCNAKCTYCYQVNKRYKDMKIEDAIGIIDKAKKSNNFNNVVDFFGGEPTMNMSLVKTIMDKYPELKFRMTTNGNFINLPASDMEYINRLNTIEISIETNEYNSKTMRNIENLANFIDTQVDHFMNNTKTELWFNIVLNIFNINDEFESIMNKLLNYYHKYKERFFIKIFPMVDVGNVVGDFDSNQSWFDFIFKYKETNKELYKLLLAYYDNTLKELINEKPEMICECEYLASFDINGNFIHCTHWYDTPVLHYNEMDMDESIQHMNQILNDKCTIVKETKCNCKECPIINKDHCFVCRRVVDNAIKNDDYNEMYLMCERSQLRYAMLLELIHDGEMPLPLYGG